METMQLQCGKCGQMMAISLEHLGSQVHCPHCQAVVQTPVKVTPPEVAETLKLPSWLEPPETESIFAPPEPSDDLFGDAPARPLLEIPPPRPPERSPESAVKLESPSPATQHKFEPAPSASDIARGGGWLEQYAAPSAEGHEQAAHASAAELAAMSAHRPHKRSLLVPTLLIFLIPYSLITTGFIVYIFIQNRNNVHALEILLDPKAKEGARQHVPHNIELPPHLKTRLGQTLRVGDIEVTPLMVRRTPTGDLALHLRVKNVSSDTLFKPISDEFLRYNEKNPAIYTFLELGAAKQHVYGGFVDSLKGPPGKDKKSDGDLGPGQDEVLRITTLPRYQKTLANVTAQDAMLWRVQVRRGFVQIRGNPVSATAVVGIAFSAKDIETEG